MAVYSHPSALDVTHLSNDSFGQHRHRGKRRLNVGEPSHPYGQPAGRFRQSDPPGPETGKSLSRSQPAVLVDLTAVDADGGRWAPRRRSTRLRTESGYQQASSSAQRTSATPRTNRTPASSRASRTAARRAAPSPSTRQPQEAVVSLDSPTWKDPVSPAVGQGRIPPEIQHLDAGRARPEQHHRGGRYRCAQSIAHDCNAKLR